MHENETIDPAIRALLDDLREPGSDDPREWTPPEVIGLVVQVAYGVEALRHRHEQAWDDEGGPAEELLFVRDMLEDWLALFGEEALEDVLVGDLAALPLPSESDRRLTDLYREYAQVRATIDAEYARFRDDIAPPRRHTWWWLDAELAGRRLH